MWPEHLEPHCHSSSRARPFSPQPIGDCLLLPSKPHPDALQSDPLECQQAPAVPSCPCACPALGEDGGGDGKRSVGLLGCPHVSHPQSLAL